MREYHIDRRFKQPRVDAVVSGPRGARRITLVFDTGAARTQLNLDTTRKLGYSTEHSVGTATAIGVGGAEEAGYRIVVPRLHVLQSELKNIELSVFDMSYLYGIVELADQDWPDAEPHPRSGYVCAHAPNREELAQISRGPLAKKVRYLCVTDPKQNVQVVFWANLHQWRNPQAFGIDPKNVKLSEFKLVSVTSSDKYTRNRDQQA